MTQGILLRTVNGQRDQNKIKTKDEKRRLCNLDNMTLFKALAMSEDLNCRIIHRGEGIIISAKTIHGSLAQWPEDGWALDETPQRIVFETVYLNCGKADHEGEATAFIFEGHHLTSMPQNTKMKVTLEPIA